MNTDEFNAEYDRLICGARHPVRPVTCRLAPGHESDHATARLDVTWPRRDCAHVVIETFGDGENGPALWACADCRLRFYPACRTCVDVGHRNIEHSHQLQVIERDRLARALHDSYLRDPAMTRIEWGDLNDAEKRMWRSHARAVGDEYERLSALDSTTGDERG